MYILYVLIVAIGSNQPIINGVMGTYNSQHDCLSYIMKNAQEAMQNPDYKMEVSNSKVVISSKDASTTMSCHFVKETKAPGVPT